LLKKTMAGLVPLVAVVGIALVPAGASGDTQCPKGTTNPAYCTEVCKVPKLKAGTHLTSAESQIRAHDCTVGKITKHEADNDKKKKNKGNGDKIEHGFEGGVVTGQSPGGGTVHPKGTKVNLTVET
jgi:hypothetical protein